ncbi:MAG: hypothetical protein QOJ76_1857 [Acidobacteriota bacterium]|jgi:hypothetical protein|nr:hypothetical protein [Acidobacteriota bacterium]
MFCPKCGTTQSDEVKFCKACGANLHAVRQVFEEREVLDKFDWSKTWVAEMFLSEGERKRRNVELELQRGITPEVKRYNEIKAGVITSSIGLALMIFLGVFMEGVILGGNVPPDAVEILRRIWVVGVIPIFIGIALIINGLFVSKRQVELARRLQQQHAAPDALPASADRPPLRAADTSEFLPPDFSVTEATTKHLGTSNPKP